MSKKPTTSSMTLSGSDAKLAEYLPSMKLQSWEIRHMSNGRTHLYIRCVPETKNVKFSVA